MKNLDENKKRIGILGGAFDPPHFGHMWVVSCVLNSGEVDQVWIVPSGTRRDKNTVAPGWARAEMVERIVEACFGKDERICTCSVEIEEGSQIEGSVELLEELEKRYQNFDFKLIIGADLVSKLTTWRHLKKLKQYKFLVVNRPGVEIEKPEGFIIKAINTPLLLDISAHQLREMLAGHQYVAGLMPPAVERIAHSHYSA